MACRQSPETSLAPGHLTAEIAPAWPIPVPVRLAIAPSLILPPCHGRPVGPSAGPDHDLVDVLGHLLLVVLAPEESHVNYRGPLEVDQALPKRHGRLSWKVRSARTADGQPMPGKSTTANDVPSMPFVAQPLGCGRWTDLPVRAGTASHNLDQETKVADRQGCA